MGNLTFHPLVTVSATYGTGGSVIAPRLAEALELPFIDRFISADLPDMAHAVRSEEGLARRRTGHPGRPVPQLLRPGRQRGGDDGARSR